MNIELQKHKNIVRQFIQVQYTNQRLAMLIDHLRSGAFNYASCCCLIGIPTSNHRNRQLRGHGMSGPRFSGAHYTRSRYEIVGAMTAEQSTYALGIPSGVRTSLHFDNRLLIRRLLPIALGEVRRRNLQVTYDDQKHLVLKPRPGAVLSGTPDPSRRISK